MYPFHLHSKYNPHKEAEQFISSIDGNPIIIVITEPGESYLASAIKDRFPRAKRIAVRYTEALFSDSDPLWDAVWRPRIGSLPFFLLSHIPDEKLAGTRFLSWKPADKAFPDAASTVWSDIRYAITLITSVMHTRSFFGNKWLKNSIDNFIRLEHPTHLTFGMRDFILAGAGPSLERLTAAQAAPYSLVAVSSALTALRARHIPIDLCIATDAGYWAREHFYKMPASIPVAFPLEAAVPAAIVERNPCVPLSYSSPLERALFQAAGIEPVAACENGTVTGTACSLLLQHTDQNIVLAGLDLQGAKGFTHARPHSGIARTSCTATKLTPLAEALAVQNFSSQSLETYRQWFLQLSPQWSKRLCRIGVDVAPLANIKTVTNMQDVRSALPSQQEGFLHGFKSRSSTSGDGSNGSTSGSGSSRLDRGSHLSVEPYAAPSRDSRRKIALSLLHTVRTDIQTLIAKDPMILTSSEAYLEKHICALASYTAYCNVIKNPQDKKIQQDLLEKVTTVLSALIKRVEA